MKEDMYIVINKKEFEENKSKLEINYEDNDVTYVLNHTVDNFGKQILFEPIETSPELDLDDETITISGDITINNKRLGFVSLTTKIDINIVSEIVNTYVKKLNKLKTVLEATK